MEGTPEVRGRGVRFCFWNAFDKLIEGVNVFHSKYIVNISRRITRGLPKEETNLRPMFT